MQVTSICSIFLVCNRFLYSIGGCGGGGGGGGGGDWGFMSQSSIFCSYGYVTIAGEGLHSFTYARHSWPLSTDGSLACYVYCDKGHQLIMVILMDR